MLNINGSEKVQVHLMGFCVGSVCIHGSVLVGYISSNKIASIISLSAAPFMDVPGYYFYPKQKLPVFEVVRSVLTTFSGARTYSFGRSPGNWIESSMRSMVSLMSYYTLADSCSLANHPDKWCYNFGFVVNPPLLHLNLSLQTHARIPDVLGHVSLNVLHQTISAHRKGQLISNPSRSPSDKYQVGSDVSAKKYNFPVTLITGEKNNVYAPSGHQKTVDWLNRCNGTYKYQVHIVPNFGFFDVVLGDEARIEIYPLILRHLISVDQQ